MVSAEEVKSRIPKADKVARDLYGIEFRNGRARCPRSANHNHGDRNPSLCYDVGKQRIFCASQGCFGGESGVDTIGLVQEMDGCEFKEALNKLASQYSPSVSRSGVSEKPKSSAAGQKRKPAEEVRQSLLKQGFRFGSEFFYSEDLRKVRLERNSSTDAETGKPKKRFLWEHRAEGKWWSGAGDRSKPLYVNQVFRERDQVESALGFEGEAKADKAGELGFPAFSYKDGLTTETAAALAGCDVILWPDKDDSGAKQAQAAAKIIADAKQARSIGVISPPQELPATGDIIDAVETLRFDQQRIQRLVTEARPFLRGENGDKSTSKKTVGERTPRPVTTISAADLCLKAYPPTEWYVENMFRAGDMAAFVAKQKVGKSLLMMQLAASVSAGIPFLGHRVIKPRKVLYLDFENKPPDIQNRLRKMYADRAKAFNQLRFYCPESMGEREIGLWDPSSRQRFADTIAAEDPDLLIIDVLNLFFGCKENDAGEMTTRLMQLAQIRKLRPGLTIILLHHLRKSVGDQQRVQLRCDPDLWVEYARGSNTLLSHVDMVYGLEHEREDPNDPGIYAFGGISRSFKPPALLLERDPDSLLYRIASQQDTEEKLFTPLQRELWDRLPLSFRFTQALKDLSCHRKLLAAVIRRARDHGMLEQIDRTWYKADALRAEQNTEVSAGA